MHKYLENTFFIKFLKEYNNNFEYINFSKSFKVFSVDFLLLVTIENKKIITYFGRSIYLEKFIFENNLLREAIFKYLNYLILKYNIKKCDVRINIENEILLNKNLNFNVINELYVDLQYNEINLKKKFCQSHRTVLNKSYPDLNYKIIDYKNYNCEIDRKSTRLNSSHMSESRMPSSA